MYSISDAMFVQWDFAFGVGKNLTWCAANCALGPQLVPVPVEGEFEEPFTLVSVKSGDSITLRAVHFIKHVYYTPIVCRYDEHLLAACRTISKVAHLNVSGEFLETIVKPDYEFFDEY
jgi:hypothetical protein